MKKIPLPLKDYNLYCITFENNITKIGISKNPKIRIGGLKSKYGKKIKEKCIFKFNKHADRDEGFLKSYFKNYKVHGEYFAISIENIKYAMGNSINIIKNNTFFDKT